MPLQNPQLRNIVWPVPDVSVALAFYRDVVGLPVKFVDGDRYAALDAGGITLALASAAEDLTDGVPAFSLRVDDLAEAVAELTAAGATVVTPPTAGPHELRAVLRDPAGQLFIAYSALPAPEQAASR